MSDLEEKRPDIKNAYNTFLVFNGMADYLDILIRANIDPSIYSLRGNYVLLRSIKNDILQKIVEKISNDVSCVDFIEALHSSNMEILFENAESRNMGIQKILEILNAALVYDNILRDHISKGCVKYMIYLLSLKYRNIRDYRFRIQSFNATRSIRILFVYDDNNAEPVTGCHTILDFIDGSLYVGMGFNAKPMTDCKLTAISVGIMMNYYTNNKLAESTIRKMGNNLQLIFLFFNCIFNAFMYWTL